MKNLDGEIFVFEYVIFCDGIKSDHGTILAKSQEQAEGMVKELLVDSSHTFYISNFEAPIQQNIAYGGSTYITPNYVPPATLTIPNDYPFGKYQITCANC